MRLTLPPIVIPVGVGLLAASAVPLHVWSGLTSSLLPCISVVGAAVFVRLARGLPFNNPDHFADRKEAKETADIIIKIARALERLIYIVLICMALLVLSAPLQKVIAERIISDSATNYIESVYSGILGLSVSFVFVRMLQIVRSDISLAKKQRDIVVGVIDRKNAKSFESALPPPESRNIAGQENFGRIIQ